MGPTRSLLEICNRTREQKGTKRNNAVPQSWWETAKQWHWRERAEAWDAENRRQRIAAEEQARAEMIERHLKLGRGLQQVGAMRLQQLGKTPKDLTGGEARQFIKIGVAIERQARGLPEYLLAVAAMTDTELRERYAALVGTIAQTGSDGSGDGVPGNKAVSETETETDATV